MAKDMLGMEIGVGDTLSVTLTGTQVVAEVAEVLNGGIITGRKAGGEHQQAGFVRCLVRVDIPFNPQNPVLMNAVKTALPRREDASPSLKLVQ